MRITWFGHAAFLIEADGLRVILDPYRSPDCGGYAPIDERADVVVVSHENDKYHSHLGQIRGDFEVVRGLELPAEGQVARGVRFEAVRVFETPEKLAGDEVTIVHFRVAGRRVVFLGDLGHSLSDAEVGPLRGADVVLCPAGGCPTIDLARIPGLLVAIGPRVVIPMHYLIKGKINLAIQPVDRFLEAMAPMGWPVRRAGSPHWDVDGCEGGRSIVVLEPAR